MLVSLVVVCLLPGCGQQSASPETAASPEKPAAGGSAWHHAAAGPLSARGGAAMVAADGEVLVLGGSDAAPCPPNASCVGPQEPGLRDAAAYDPRRDRWRRLAAAPVPLNGPSAVTVDGVVYVVTSDQQIGDRRGSDGIRSAFLAYSLADDTWSQLPMLPGGIETLVAMPGGRLLSVHGSHEGGWRADSLYDARTRAWSPLPRDPLAPSFDRSVVVTDAGDVVLLAVDLVDDPGVRPTLYRAAVWHPADGSWRELPRSEVVASGPSWWWSGGRVVNASRDLVDGGEVNNYGRAYPTGGLLDPATGTWTTLPRSPDKEQRSGPGFAAAGDGVVVSGKWALRVAAGTWTPVPEEDALPTQGFSTAVVGDRLVVFGGARFGEDMDLRGALLDDTWVWRLPQA